MKSNEAELVTPTKLSELFWVFCLLALQGFGGVAAITQRELVERRRWLTREGFLEDWSVAQILPGPNIINLAAMLGDRWRGVPGACAAVAGMCLFPLLILLTMAVFFVSIRDVPEVQGALRGMGIAVAALIVQFSFKLVPALRGHPSGAAACALFGCLTFVAIAVLRWPLAWVLLGIGGLSCAWTYLQLKTVLDASEEADA